MSEVPIRSTELDAIEVAWFAALCDDDFKYLGVQDDTLRSTWQHCSEITSTADQLGYNNILLPNGYVAGQDTLTFAAGMAPLTQQISLLVAIRCGEYHPPMLGRALASLDHMLEGRLTVNIISSDMPGTTLPSEQRYQRSREVIEILKQGWQQDHVHYSGDFYQFDLPATPMKTYQQNGGPLLYFGGISEPARDLCARQCDVFLMWPETESRLAETMQDMSQRAARYDRTIDFGLRIHVICRETEREAQEAARQLVSRLDDQTASSLKHRSMDSRSLGVQRQNELRAEADQDGYIEPCIWSGIGRGRSGCGSAIVGTPDQVLEKIKTYTQMGMRSFIFSGYPHLDECNLFGRHVLPELKTCQLSTVQQRRIENPLTPLSHRPPS